MLLDVKKALEKIMQDILTKIDHIRKHKHRKVTLDGDGQYCPSMLASTDGTVELMDIYGSIDAIFKKIDIDILSTPKTKRQMAVSIIKILDAHTRGNMSKEEDVIATLGRYAHCGLIDSDGSINRTIAGRIGAVRTDMVYHLLRGYRHDWAELHSWLVGDGSPQDLQALRRLEMEMRHMSEKEKEGRRKYLIDGLFARIVGYHALYYSVCDTPSVCDTLLHLHPEEDEL